MKLFLNAYTISINNFTTTQTIYINDMFYISPIHCFQTFIYPSSSHTRQYFNTCASQTVIDRMEANKHATNDEQMQ